MRIYVGNLEHTIVDEQLEELFAQFGAVKDRVVVTDKETGNSRGFGFVEMEDSANAQAAIDALNGSESKGRTLTVNEARPKKPKSSRK